MSVRIFAALGLLALPIMTIAQDKPATNTQPNQTAPKPPVISVPT